MESKACLNCGVTFWRGDHDHRLRCAKCEIALAAQRKRVMAVLKRRRKEREAEIQILNDAERRI